ncbi:calcium/sodium antiporter [Polynucleobacter antarcticus]|uniref:Sodium:calcium antiporter n=1 Tax=Polynucleobacter antarcticus TaxID=1743162 RepID=A0A6M9PJU3_9BURK|nr:calcium/sodium antiporter [Polynucleobacter antarcticus]QKM62394.1 sodium:calcium antiporter [Polynucleobacter antarcticus]
MMTHGLLFIAGLAALFIGANALVHGASKLALSLGIQPLVVGLTVVAFGTSAPEMAVSTGAVINGQADIAIGNVVGSNIFNTLFILGLSALIAPLVVHSQLIRQEVPVMIGTIMLLVALSLDGIISIQDGGLLFFLMIAYTVFLIRQSRQAPADQTSEFDLEFTKAKPNAWDSKWPIQVGLIIFGLVFLVLGSDWLVTASIMFAKLMGISDLVIGLTIVAAGTSMPEVAASLVAAFKGERDIAIGNVIGSNIFNVLGSLGLAGLVSGLTGMAVAPSLLTFDLWVLAAVSLACLPIFLSGREIARWEGGVFLIYYIAYVTYMIMSAQSHDTLPQFSSVMLSFVLPLTIITLVVSLLGRPKPSSK